MESCLRTVKIDDVQLEMARYSAMSDYYYNVGMELDKMLLNWSTLALIGLLALGVGRPLCELWLRVVWVLAVVLFGASGFLARRSMVVAQQNHGDEVDNYFYEVPEAEKRVRGKKMSCLNNAYFFSFCGGILLSFVLVLSFVF
jgi:hypothetical protein